MNDSSNKCFIVSVDGNIGSGKSTFVENIKKHLRLNTTYQKIIFLQEPVDEWDTIRDSNNKTILEYFYEDQEKHSFSFQMMAYISRLAQLRETIRNNPGAVIIVERSIYTDRNIFAKMLYDDKKISEIEYKIYLKWFDEFAKEYPLDCMIYIKTSPEIAHKRVIKRNRKGEAIPIEYLTKCNDYHDRWFKTITVPVHTINADKENTYDVNKKWVEDALLFITIEKIKNKDILKKSAQKNVTQQQHDEFVQTVQWLTGC